MEGMLGRRRRNNGLKNSDDDEKQTIHFECALPMLYPQMSLVYDWFESAFGNLNLNILGGTQI